MKYIISWENIGKENINQEFRLNKNCPMTARNKKYQSKIKKKRRKTW